MTIKPLRRSLFPSALFPLEKSHPCLLHAGTGQNKTLLPLSSAQLSSSRIIAAAAHHQPLRPIHAPSATPGCCYRGPHPSPAVTPCCRRRTAAAAHLWSSPPPPAAGLGPPHTHGGCQHCRQQRRNSDTGKGQHSTGAEGQHSMPQHMGRRESARDRQQAVAQVCICRKTAWNSLRLHRECTP